jgi:hypothetical protein
MLDQSHIYELRLYDQTLLSFVWQPDARDACGVHTLSLDEGAIALLPSTLTIDQRGEAIASWLASRGLPGSRAYADAIAGCRDLDLDDLRGIVDASMVLSVNDAYWVVPEGFDGRWHDVNLYENPLDDSLARVAFTGQSVACAPGRALGHRGGPAPSPEWTTMGTFPKAWRRVDGRLVLYKTANPLYDGAANPDHSVWSEYLASQVAEAIGVSHASYGLDLWEGRVVSTCALINDVTTALVPYHMASNNLGYENVLATYARMGDSWLEAGLDMFMFDALVCNTDRHASNFSVLRDNRTGEWLAPAPLFDHNLSLFPTDMPMDFGGWPHRAETLCPRGATVTFDSVMDQVCLPRHVEWARRLVDFEFENHPAYPIETSRLDALNRFVRSQARRLLGKRPRDLETIRRGLPLALDDEASPMLAGPRLSVRA